MIIFGFPNQVKETMISDGEGIRSVRCVASLNGCIRCRRRRPSVAAALSGSGIRFGSLSVLYFRVDQSRPLSGAVCPF